MRAIQSGEVYDNLLADMPKSTRPVVEFLLEYYPVSERETSSMTSVTSHDTIPFTPRS